MPIVRIDNVGRYGVILDQTPWEIPPEAWSYSRNIRFSEKWAGRILGHAATFDTHDGSGNDEDPIYLLYDRQGTTNYWYLLQQKTAAVDAIIAYNGISTYKDITRSGGMTSTYNGRWNGGIIGGVPIFNSGGDDYPVYWAHDFATPTLCANLTWNASTNWSNAVVGGGTGIMARVIRPFKQHLFALYPTYPQSASPVAYPHTVMWSHPADPGTIPASWDWTDTTVDAGKTELAETGGYCVDMIQLRDIGVIYKSDGIFGVQYVGPPDVFKFYKISGQIGLLSQDCAIEFQGKHFSVGFNDIYVHDGQQIESIVADRIRASIFSTIDEDNFRRSFCQINRGESEIWFCYPETGSTHCTKAAIWNWRHNTWTFRDLPGATYIHSGTWDPGAIVTATDAWDIDGGTWDSDPTTWDQQAYAAVKDKLLMSVPGSGSLFQLESGYAFGATTPTAILERIGIAIVGRDRDGQPKIDPASRKILRHVWPRIDGEIGTAVEIWLGSQQHVDDAVAWQGPFSFTIGTTDKIDCLLQGRLFSIRFKTASNVGWRLHGYSLDMDLTSRY